MGEAASARDVDGGFCWDVERARAGVTGLEACAVRPHTEGSSVGFAGNGVLIGAGEFSIELTVALELPPSAPVGALSNDPLRFFASFFFSLPRFSFGVSSISFSAGFCMDKSSSPLTLDRVSRLRLRKLAIGSWSTKYIPPSIRTTEQVKSCPRHDARKVMVEEERSGDDVAVFGG